MYISPLLAVKSPETTLSVHLSGQDKKMPNSFLNNQPGKLLMSMVRTFNISVLLFFTASVSQAKEISLSECIATTISNNRIIKNAYLDRIYQKYDLRVAEDKFTPKLFLTPSVTGTGNVSPLGGGQNSVNSGNNTNVKSEASGTVTQLLPTGAAINLGASYDLLTTETARPGRGYGWNVTLTQPLLKGGWYDVNMASVRTARYNEQGNILTLKSTLIDTLTNVITAYRAYAQAIKSLDISRQSLERSRELVATNRELIAAGRMAAIEIVQSEADVANKEYSLLSAENALDAARLALTKAMDIDRNTRITPITREPDVPPVPYSFEQAKALAFDNRPDYQRSLISLEISRISLMLAKNNTLWDLSLTGSYTESYMRNSGGSTDSSNGNWITGLKLTIPIGDLSINQPYIAAEVALKKQENDLGRQKESIEIEVQDALRSAEMNYRQIRLAKLSRQLSEKKVEIETEKLKAGRSTNFQLVSYQNDLVNAQYNELNAIITYLNALTSLDSKLGIILDRLGVTLAER